MKSYQTNHIHKGKLDADSMVTYTLGTKVAGRGKQSRRLDTYVKPVKKRLYLFSIAGEVVRH